MHPLNVDHYHSKEIYAKLDRIVDPNTPLCDIDEAHGRALAELFRKYDYNYAHGMMTKYYFSAVTMEGAISASVVHIVNSTEVVKDGYCMVVLDSRQWRRSVKILKNENKVKWTSAPLRTRFLIFSVCKATCPAQAIKLNKFANSF